VQKIDKVVALVAEFFVDEEFSREEIAGVVREAYEVADVDFGAEEAARAAEDFEWSRVDRGSADTGLAQGRAGRLLSRAHGAGGTR